MTLDNYIWYSLDVEGMHNYPEEKVEIYLQSKHRHIFKIKVSIQTFSWDKEIEFIHAKRNMSREISKKFGIPADFETRTCAGIAKWLLDAASALHGLGRKYYIEVSEDGENGSVLIFKPDSDSPKISNVITYSDYVRPQVVYPLNENSTAIPQTQLVEM